VRGSILDKNDAEIPDVSTEELIKHCCDEVEELETHLHGFKSASDSALLFNYENLFN